MPTDSAAAPTWTADDRIFVQIPAYRDRELVSTVEALYREARRPERLRVAIAWQYHPEELPLEHALRRWEGVDLLKIPAAQSEGCNWARRLLQERWQGERYTLLLDSHHRFIPGWDEVAVGMLEGLRSAGVTKPILTGYLPPYQPDQDPEGRSPALLGIRSSGREGGLLFRLVSEPVPEAARLLSPFPARFTSLHFLLADGSFNEEVVIDSSIYFFVDEITMALRAYTRGYDLYHPHRVLGWHLYDRATRTPHWQDHARWQTQNQISCQRARAMYRGRLTGRYGIGSRRTVADYEALIGEPLLIEGT